MDIRYFQLIAALLGGLLIFSVTACGDSSSVGLGVGPDSLEGGEPRTIDLAPDTLDTTVQAPRTGLRTLEGTWRFLTGSVEDPVAGGLEAEGYVDFLGRASLPEQIIAAEADELSAELRLTTTYLHGDTASTADARLFDLSEEASMDQARADTTFPAETEEITNASFSPTDSLITIELPASWIQEHLEVLQDTSGEGSAFQEDFHGFKLTASNSEAVVGFSSTGVTLRLTHEADDISTDFQGIKTFTHVERHSAPSPPEDYILLQDGIGTNLLMGWNFNAPPLDTLRPSPLNRAEIYVPADTSALDNSIENTSFVRPHAQGFRVIATRTEEAPSCSSLLALPITQDGLECALQLVPRAAPGAVHINNDVAFPIFEQSLLDSPVFSTYRVEVADRVSSDIQPSGTFSPGLPSTLPVLIPTATEGDGPPRATLTITPL